MKNINYIFICLSLLLCISCQHTDDPKSRSVGFDITQSSDTTHITVYSPWQTGKVMAKYMITEPFERVVCTSSTHIGFIHELGLTDKVVGACRPERIYNLTPEQRSRIIDIGDDIRPNMEAILLAKPDAVIISTYAEGDYIPQQIESLGIPVFYCNEWTEQTPLARAEWIRFFGACFGCIDRADSIYNTVSKEYQAMIKSTGGTSIMSGMSFRGTWYVPTGTTFMGRFFKDAGAQYHYADRTSATSLPLTMEQAIQDLAEADVWIGCDARTMSELKAIDDKHTWFKAYQNKRVYNFLKRSLPSGANDFWESGVVHPERILHDLQLVLKGDTNDLYYTLPLL